MLRIYLLFSFFFFALCRCHPAIESPTSGTLGIHLIDRSPGPQLAEEVGDFLKNVRDRRLTGKNFTHFSPVGLDLSSENGLKLKNHALMNLLISMIHPGKLIMDVSNIQLNPNRDWGICVGNWCIIQRLELGEETYPLDDIDDWVNNGDVPYSKANPYTTKISQVLATSKNEVTGPESFDKKEYDMTRSPSEEFFTESNGIS